MKLRWIGSAAKREFARSPIATTVTVGGSIAGAIALALSLTLPKFSVESPPVPVATSAVIAAVLGAIGISTVAGLLAQLAFRVSKLASLLTSLIIASVSVLAVTLYLDWLNVGFPISSPEPYTTDRLVYWLHLLVFIIINGEAITRSLAQASEDVEKDRDGLGLLGLLALGALIWASLLSNAQTFLVRDKKPLTVTETPKLTCYGDSKHGAFAVLSAFRS